MKRRAALLTLCACAAHVPRAPRPPQTHDVDTGLEAVLERDAVDGACDAFWRGDESARLHCGKSMFFAETFGTAGIPEGLIRYALDNYGAFYGRGFEKLGLVADPKTGTPIGLARSRGGTLAFTCASCHFGRMPDGRYAVGWGNTGFEYGRLIATVSVVLQLGLDDADPGVAPELRQLLKPFAAQAREQTGFTLRSIALGTSLLGTRPALANTGDQLRYLALAPGTMDFLTPPLVDDGVWAVSRILSLWNLRDGRLSWNGGVPTLTAFLHGFAVIGGGDAGQWSEERLAPLRDYVMSLRSPLAERTPPTGGRQIFEQSGCAACHDGPSGESTRVFTFEEVGTDSGYGRIYNPDANGKACCGFDSSVITRGVKAPRLAGVFSATRLLHDGSVTSLEALLCLADRPASGHTFGCRELDDARKQTLIAFLRSW